MKKDTRGRILEATARLLQLRGYHGTALNDILAESDSPRGSLYFHFPNGKGQIVVEATRSAVDQVTRDRVATLEAADTPGAAIRAIASDIADVLRRSDYASGCPISPIVLDGMSEWPELAALCKETFEEWITLMRDNFVKAGLLEKRAYELAVFALATFQGSVLIARACRDVAPVLSAGNQLAELVQSTLVQALSQSPELTTRGARAARRTRR